MKMFYHSIFHSVLSYGIICWGNSSQSITIFKILEKVIKVMMGCRNRRSCRNLFKILNILPLRSHYMFSSLIFLLSGKNFLTINALYLPDKDITSICLRKIRPFFSKELVMQESEYFIVFLLKLRLFQMILRNVKLH
jgi:hypothetical protein